MRPFCLLKRVRQWTADQEVRSVVEECLEVAISREDHLDPIGFSSRSFCLVGVAGRLRAAASKSLELSLGEDPLGGDNEPCGLWPSSVEDVSVALELSSSDDDGFDPEAEPTED